MTVRKIAGLMFVVLALSLVLLPANVFAAGLDKDCSWDKVKWDDNKNSVFLYLNNWGKTPLTAMSRLAGGAYPASLTGCTLNSNPGTCFGECVVCNNQVTGSAVCKDPKSCNIKPIVGFAYCAKCWGVSLGFANENWGGKSSGDYISPSARNLDTHPLHRGNSDRLSPGGGGDWGITGAPHPECKADIWALQCNLDKQAACIPVKK